MLGYKVPLQVIEDYENKLKRANEVVQPKNGSFNAFCDGVHDAFAEVRNCGLVNLEGNWHAGTPSEEGWYVLCLKRDDTEYFYTTYFRYDGADKVKDVVAYQKIEPYKEEEK